MYDSVVYKDPFILMYCPNKHKSQRLCDEAVDNSLAALKFIPDWFLTSKMLYWLMVIYLFLIKFIIKSHLMLMKDIFLMKILIKLTLMKIIILMMIMLILLFSSDVWLDVVNLKNTKHLEKIKN